MLVSNPLNYFVKTSAPHHPHATDALRLHGPIILYLALDLGIHGPSYVGLFGSRAFRSPIFPCITIKNLMPNLISVPIFCTVLYKMSHHCMVIVLLHLTIASAFQALL